MHCALTWLAMSEGLLTSSPRASRTSFLYSSKLPSISLMVCSSITHSWHSVSRIKRSSWETMITPPTKKQVETNFDNDNANFEHQLTFGLTNQALVVRDNDNTTCKKTSWNKFWAATKWQCKFWKSAVIYMCIKKCMHSIFALPGWRHKCKYTTSADNRCADNP